VIPAFLVFNVGSSGISLSLHLYHNNLNPNVPTLSQSQSLLKYLSKAVEHSACMAIFSAKDHRSMPMHITFVKKVLIGPR
jgi:hypothetical protein